MAVNNTQYTLFDPFYHFTQKCTEPIKNMWSGIPRSIEQNKVPVIMVYFVILLR